MWLQVATLSIAASYCFQYGCKLLLSVWLQVTTFCMAASYYFLYGCKLLLSVWLQVTTFSMAVSSSFRYGCKFLFCVWLQVTTFARLKLFYLLLSYGIITILLTDITYYSNRVAAKGPQGHRVKQPPCKKNNKKKIKSAIETRFKG